MEFTELQELLKKTRKEKNISLEELSKRLKVTKSKLNELENDKNFLEKNKVYGNLLLKDICNELGIEVEKIDNKNKELENFPQEEKIKKESKLLLSIKDKFLNIFKLSFLFLILLFLFHSTKFFKEKSKISKDDYPIDYNYSVSSSYVVNNSSNKLQTGIQRIFLVAKKDIWLSANIDGKDKVINLNKNKKIQLEFKKKIHFITIGNADGIVILYKNQKVTFNKDKIVHHVFIDKDGIFKNGYNLIGENT